MNFDFNGFSHAIIEQGASPDVDIEELATWLADRGVAVRRAAQKHLQRDTIAITRDSLVVGGLPSSRRARLRHAATRWSTNGVERLMFGSDYPHSAATKA